MTRHIRFTGYCCGNSEIDSTKLKEHLDSLKFELKKSGLPMDNFEVVNGNCEFPKTKDFLEEIIGYNYTDGICYDYIIEAISITKLIEQGNEAKLHENIDEEKKNILKIWRRINPSNFLNSICGRIIIVADRKFSNIKEALPGAHGISKCPGEVCLTIRGYKNIIWHETAHLLGADDHYNEENINEANPECKDPQFCIMQWNPAVKNCIFCEKSIEEIKNHY